MSAAVKRKTFFDFFPTPEYLLLSTSGITITDKDIKFVEFRPTVSGDGFELKEASVNELEGGVVEAGFVNNIEALAIALKKLSKKHHLHYVHATLPEEKAYLFTAHIDKVPFEDLRDAIAFIVEENVPVSLPNSVFDFEIVGNANNSNQIKVAVSVLPLKVVTTYIEAFEAAGMTPVSFDIESQAIARAIVRPGDTRTQLIVNLGEKGTGIYVVEDEVVQFSTTLTRTISEDGATANLHDLQTEIRKVFGFWNTRSDDKPTSTHKKIERILLCGSEAPHESLLPDLMSEFGVEYTFAELWLNSHSAHLALEKVLKESIDYLPAIGAALPH